MGVLHHACSQRWPVPDHGTDCVAHLAKTAVLQRNGRARRKASLCTLHRQRSIAKHCEIARQAIVPEEVQQQQLLQLQRRKQGLAGWHWWWGLHQKCWAPVLEALQGPCLRQRVAQKTS